MIHYILQVIVFQAFFLIIYDLFLKKETFFITNRCYLVLAPIIGLIAPIINFATIQQKTSVSAEPSVATAIISIKKVMNRSDAVLTTHATFEWEWILWIGSGFFLVLFLIKLWKIQGYLKQGTSKFFKEFKVIELTGSTAAFSFFNYMFLGSQIEKPKKEVIIAHELVHIRHRHSYDLLFFELLKIVMWYNPLVYIFQKRTTELHEYTVDAEVAKTQGKQAYYQNLLTEVFNAEDISFINQFFNQSLIKKRISMLTKNKSKQIQQIKYLLVVPLLAGIVFYTSCTENQVAKEPSIVKDGANAITQTSDVSSGSRTGYKSGDTPKSFEHIKQAYDEKIDNYLKINTTPHTEAVVKMVRLPDSVCVRVVYLEANGETYLKNIPEGKYFIKTAYGNNWEEKIVNGKLKGFFAKNALYKIGGSVINFNIIQLPEGMDVPSYELLLDVDHDDESNFEQEESNREAF